MGEKKDTRRFTGEGETIGRKKKRGEVRKLPLGKESFLFGGASI